MVTYRCFSMCGSNHCINGHRGHITGVVAPAPDLSLIIRISSNYHGYSSIEWKQL